MYECGLGAGLPEGFRLPRFYRVKDLGDERLALVLEDVRTTAAPWDLARFARAAELLGRLAVWLPRGDCLLATAVRVPDEITGLYYTGRVVPAVLPALADDAIWNHPLLAGDPGPQRDLLELARRIPPILQHLVRLPQLMGHGDASRSASSGAIVWRVSRRCACPRCRTRVPGSRCRARCATLRS